VNILRNFSYLIIFITVACIFSFAIRLSVEGNRLGVFTEPIRTFSNFPRVAYYAINQVSSPERFVKIDQSLSPVNKLDYELKVLGSRFETDHWVIYLKSLTSNKVYHEWNIAEKDFTFTDRVFSHADPRTPIMLEDSSIIVNIDESMNLFRIDKNSNIIWKNNSHHFHHSINPAVDSNIWACSKSLKELTNKKGDKLVFYDDYLTKVDVKNGKTLYNKSISEIFKENSLNYFVHGFNNLSIAGGTDPFHLNDIEEVTESGKYLEKGDLIISLRNRSMVMVYNPSSSIVKRIIQGPFYNQHDVDLINDSTIRLFNNNVSSLETNGELRGKEVRETNLNQHAEVVDYHIEDSSFTKVFAPLFRQEGVFTLTQGLYETLPNGDLLVESQNSGLIYVFSKEGVLFKNYVHEIKSGLVEPPHWLRVIQ
jgi:hypothetical protein